MDNYPIEEEILFKAFFYGIGFILGHALVLPLLTIDRLDERSKRNAMGL